MTKKSKIDHYSDKEALDFHIKGKSGKIEINSSKPLTTKRDLSLAYSPGVAAPVKEIAKNPDLAYDYTSKGNLVAVISNGSAILGLGNLGALASKPVMEGKSVLFKRFADIDSIDIEMIKLDTLNNTTTVKLSVEQCLKAVTNDINMDIWEDKMGNGIWDEGERFIDKDGNGIWSDTDDFVDQNEDFTDWSFPNNGYLHLLIADIFLNLWQ